MLVYKSIPIHPILAREGDMRCSTMLFLTAGEREYILERLHYDVFKTQIKSPNLNFSEKTNPEIQDWGVLKRF